MRKLYYILPVLLCPWIPGKAQIVEDSISMEAMLDRAFSELNLSHVPSGILMDMVPAYVEYKYFRGDPPPDSIWLPGKMFPLLYGMLDQAHTSASPLENIEEWWDTFEEKEVNDTLKLGLIWFSYDKVREDAFEEELLSFSVDRFYDVPGRSVHPYTPDTLFAASVMRYKVSEEQQLIHFDTSLFFSNLVGTAPTLQVDAGDGLGWRNISPNGVISVTFNQDTVHLIKVRLLSSLGRDWYGNAAVKKSGASSLQEDNINGREYSVSPDQTISGLEGVEGVTMFVFHNKACGDAGMLRKPLILIEGFDPGNENDWTLILGNEGEPLLEFDFGDPNQILLKDHIHSGGYDIVFVDFSDGSASIIENAQRAKAAIRKINELKAANGSSEKNVVIGASAGGVIGKWALREMEIAEDDHETEMFITFDSPMRGANIPMSIQAYVKDMNTMKIFFKTPADRQESGLAKAAWQAILSPAAKQILYYHINGCYDNNNCDLTNISTMHSDFFSQFKSLEDLSIPEYAIINGAINGASSEEFNPGEYLLNADVQSHFGIGTGDEFGVPGVHWIKLHVQLWSLPGGGSSDFVYYRNFTHVVGIFPFYSYTYCKIVEGIPQNYDNAPGSLTEFPGGTDENWLHNSFCFIPTISALSLDITDPFHSGFNLENPSTILQNNTPINGYIGSRFASSQNGVTRTNQNHISLDQFTAPYLRSLILKTDDMIGSNGELSSTYNFGKANTTTQSIFPLFPQTPNNIDKDLEVLDGGKLWVNRFGKIGDIANSGNPENQMDIEFEVTIGKNTCTGEGVIVSIEDGGELILGDADNPHKNKGNLTIHDDGILIVRSGGEAILNDESRITIDEEGLLEIKEGGLLNTIFGSGISVKAGGKLIVRDGGILRLSHYSSLTIEPGGLLIFEDGAILQLWDAPAVDGEARIIVKGALEIQGDIEYDGNGFFDFYPGHELKLTNGTLTLEGNGKVNRFIRLSEGANLNLGSAEVEISDCRIVYEGQCTISAEEGGLNFTNVDFQGYQNKSTGIEPFNVFRLQMEGCTFRDHDFGLNIEGVTGAAMNSGFSF